MAIKQAATQSPKELPIILCFHGAGTNGVIFKLQTRKIIQALRSHFRFVFLDAPFESLPEPRVGAVLLDLGPFFRWHCDENAAAGFDVGIDEIKRERAMTRQLLLDTMRLYGSRNIVGVMGFSQGTRVATAICLDEVLGRGIRFAIIIAGTFPILSVDEEGQCKELWLGHPSVHVQGSRDPWQPESIRLLKTYYDAAQAVVVKFDGAHQVPTEQGVVDEIAKAVLSVMASGQGSQVGEEP
ncbi:serine hydrolase FSH [Aspergillus pseudoustus]|uniref:Serine hydrolase FSH n=1 Tax=Aspergillus pseudoustus TaxID=1810923 RepID=A0ABR4IZJ9_9EURO